jgi:phospholipase/lecithinase/hemolysin
LGALPRYSGTLEAPSATDFSIEFNTGLAQMVGRFQQDNLQILIDQCDIHSMFSEILANPNQYGFNNVTEASPNFTVENNFDNSAGYLFWDNTHPATETHALVAERAFLLVNASNETPINNPDETPHAESDNDDSCFISVLW